jgi:hypothetical protein
MVFGALYRRSKKEQRAEIIKYRNTMAFIKKYSILNAQ